MKIKNLTIALTGMGMLLGATPSAHALSIGVFGPSGEVISYEKQGDGVHIRICQKNTLKSEIEGDQGCTVKDGTAEVVLSEKDFRAYVNTGLAQIDKSVLSPAQKSLLEKDLTDLPNLDDKRKELKDLQAQLKKLDAYRAENPNDYDVKEEKNLTDKIKCIQDSISGYADIIDAKNQVSDIIDQLITDMNGKPIKQLLRHSSDGSGISYNLLRGLVSAEACNAGKVEKAAPGYLCRAGNVLWQVGTDQAGTRIYTDLKSGMKVTGVVATGKNFDDSQKSCPAGYHVPTAGLKDENGSWSDVNNQTGDFATLNADGIRSVIPGMSSHWFWSSSPRGAESAFGFGGYYGGIHYVTRSYTYYYEGVVCVSGR